MNTVGIWALWSDPHTKIDSLHETKHGPPEATSDVRGFIKVNHNLCYTVALFCRYMAS